MKALVAYYSQTGNTEKVARAIYEAITMEKTLAPVTEVESVAGYDIVFIGFPVHSHSVPSKALPIFKLLAEGQKIAFFSTHGSLRGGQLPKQAVEHALGLAVKAKVLGTFGCRGGVDERIIEMLMQKPEHKAWAEEAQGAAQHPDAHDLADAKEFARQVIAKVGD